MIRTNQRGFTIVELMIATAVFAAVLLVITIATIQIGRTYYKGIVTTRTQETTRAVVDELAQAIQFGSGRPEINLPGGVVCAGGKRFSFELDRQVASSQGALRLADVASCAGQTQDMSSGRELLGSRMRLAGFEVEQVAEGGEDDDDGDGEDEAIFGSNLYRITVKVVSGDDDVLSDDHNNCATERAGTQFCAVSELTTTVQRRL